MPRNQSCLGITLIELMVVLIIMSILGSVAVLIYTGGSNSATGTAFVNQIDALLRAARSHAATHGGSAAVCYRKTGNDESIFVLVHELVGQWHMEDLVVTGANGLNAQLPSGGGLVPGVVGKALQLNGMMDCGSSPQFRLPDGFVFELWVNLQDDESKTLATKGSEFSLEFAKGNYILYKVGASAVQSVQRVLPRTWTHIVLRASGGTAELVVNGVRWSIVGVDQPIPASDAPLLIGGSWQGLIDEVSLYKYSVARTYGVPKDMDVAFSGVQSTNKQLADQSITFDTQNYAGGGASKSVCSGGTITFKTNVFTEILTVDTYGVISRVKP